MERRLYALFWFRYRGLMEAERQRNAEALANVGT